MTDVVATRVLRREARALEDENAHLKEMLSEMADALYADGHRIGLLVALERLVVLWIERQNRAALRALAATRELNRRDVESRCGTE